MSNDKWACNCKDCQEYRERMRQQFEHPFYKRVEKIRGDIKHDTLLKAAEKYPEPFNPASWSAKQLLWHAMAENYDQGNYIVGLYDVAVAIEKEKERYKKALEKIAYDDTVLSNTEDIEIAIEALEGDIENEEN